MINFLASSQTKAMLKFVMNEEPFANYFASVFVALNRFLHSIECKLPEIIYCKQVAY